MRAAIFIDGGYLIKQLQDAKVTPDYGRLAEYLLKPLRRNIQLDLMRCYFYYCPPWMSEKPTDAELRRMAGHERFMAEIQEGCDRWQVRLGKLERRWEGDKEVFAQKRVDVQLSVDLVHHTAAGHIQHAVLVAGDSDFIPAIVAAKESGTTLTLWCDRDRSVHRDLLKLSDEVHYIRWKEFPSKAPPEQRSNHQNGRGGEARGDLQPRQADRAEAPVEPAQRLEGRGEVRAERPEPRPVEVRLHDPLAVAVTAPTPSEQTPDALAPSQPKPTRGGRGRPRGAPAEVALPPAPSALPESAESIQPAPAEAAPSGALELVDGEVAKKKRGRRRGSGKGKLAAQGEPSSEATAGPLPAGPVTHVIGQSSGVHAASSEGKPQGRRAPSRPGSANAAEPRPQGRQAASRPGSANPSEGEPQGRQALSRPGLTNASEGEPQGRRAPSRPGSANASEGGPEGRQGLSRPGSANASEGEPQGRQATSRPESANPSEPKPQGRQQTAQRPRSGNAPEGEPRPSGRHEASGGPGDDIGNLRPSDEAPAATGGKNGRRRRGGRGRRRKSNGTPSAE